MHFFTAIIITTNVGSINSSSIEVQCATINDVPAAAKAEWVKQQLADAHEYEIEDAGMPITNERDILTEWRKTNKVVYAHSTTESKCF